MTNNGSISNLPQRKLNSPSKRVRINAYYKSEARKTIFAKDNLYKSIFSFIITVMLSIAVIVVSSFVFSLFSEYDLTTISADSNAVLDRIMFILSVYICSFTVFVFFAGVFRYYLTFDYSKEKSLLSPNIASMDKMLCMVDSKVSFVKSFKLFLFLMFFFMICNIPFLAVMALLVKTNLCPVLFYVAYTAFILIFVFYIFSVITVYHMNGSTKTTKILFNAFKVMLCSIFDCFYLLISFIPLIAVSILTFGALFVIYTAPYMLMSYTKLYKTCYYCVTENN